MSDLTGRAVGPGVGPGPGSADGAELVSDHGPVGAPAVGDGGPAGAPGYSPRRTLPLAVEAIRQLRRRRTMIAFGILLVLPWILVGAFELSGNGASDSQTPGLVADATFGGLNFAGFAFFASVGFLLVVAVALFCGDTVATEASWASLRYLLAAPVPRSRLLRQKLIVALGYSSVAVISLPLMALLAGTVAFGWHPLKLPASGVQLSTGAALGRLGIVLGYVLITELMVASLAFLLSVCTDSPLGAVGGAVGLVIVSNILDAVTALGNWRQLLPTHWQFSWLNMLQPQISWTAMIEGAAVSVSYAIVLFALAFRRFGSKDILS
jgi:ABC-2 type transport system permease protein